MSKAMRYKCVMCGKVVKAKKPRRTCSDKCRVAYFRYIQDGGEERPVNCLDKETVTANVTGKSSVTQTPPAHEQAYKPPEGHKLITDEMHDLFMQLLREKKSGNQTTIFMPLSETTVYTETPLPKIEIREESPEMKKKREDEAKKRSIANTLASLEDF